MSGSRRTNADDIELKAAFQQLLLDLVRDAVETDVVFGEDALHLLRVHRGRHCSSLVSLPLQSRSEQI